MSSQIFSDKIPLSFQISRVLRERIESGELAAGDRLPPEKEMAKDLGVGVVTVQSALKDLSSAGLITRHRRRGTFVSDRAQVQPEQSDALALMFSVEFGTDTKILTKKIVPRPEKLKSVFPDDVHLLHIRRLVFRGNVPWNYANIFLPAAFDDRITRSMLKRYPMFRLLREKLKLRFDKVAINLQARPAGVEIATLMQTEPLSAVTVLNATLFDLNGRAVNWLESHYRGDNFVFRFEMNLRGKHE